MKFVKSQFLIQRLAELAIAYFKRFNELFAAHLSDVLAHPIGDLHRCTPECLRRANEWVGLASSQPQPRQPAEDTPAALACISGMHIRTLRPRTFWPNVWSLERESDNVLHEAQQRTHPLRPMTRARETIMFCPTLNCVFDTVFDLSNDEWIAVQVYRDGNEIDLGRFETENEAYDFAKAEMEIQLANKWARDPRP
jgi:hypothetical protein